MYKNNLKLIYLTNKKHKKSNLHKKGKKSFPVKI
jgi:hypothetical protein